MGFDFIQPGLLWGAALLLVPLLIHLFNRRRYVRRPWAAMEFLERAFRKVRRRVRLENLLLLLLRCAIPVLLAFALARPTVDRTSPLAGMSDTNRHHVLVVDATLSTSLKGGAGGRPISRARKLVTDFLESLGRQEFQKVSMIRVDTVPRVITQEETSMDRAMEQVTQLCRPGFGHGRLVEGLDLALDVAGGQANNPRFIVITDLQRSTLGEEGSDKVALDPLADALDRMGRMSNDRTLILDTSAVETPPNATILSLEATTPIAVKGMPLEFRARIRNLGKTPLKGLQVTFALDGDRRPSAPVDIPPGGTGEATTRFSVYQEGPHWLQASLPGDALEGDDRAWLSFAVRDRIRTLLVDGRPEPLDRFLLSATGYLERILNPEGDDGARGISPFATTTMVEEDFLTGRLTLDEYDLLILAELRSLSLQAAEAVTSYVARGGGLLLIPGDKTEPAAWNLRLGADDPKGLLPVRLIEVAGFTERGDNCFYPSLAAASEHPVLSDLQGPLRIILKGTPIYRFMRAIPCRPAAQVLLTLDDESGSPLLVTGNYRQGRVLWLASPVTGDDRRWNELSSPILAFPLLHQAGLHLARSQDRALNLAVGSPLSARFPIKPREIQLAPPGGRPRPMRGKATLSGEGDYRWTPWTGVDKPGIYRLDISWPQGAPAQVWPVRYVAANVDPAEGRLERWSPQALEKRLAGIPYDLARHLPGRAEQLFDERGGDIGYRVLYLVMAFLLLEGLLAALFGRGRK